MECVQTCVWICCKNVLSLSLICRGPARGGQHVRSTLNIWNSGTVFRPVPPGQPKLAVREVCDYEQMCDKYGMHLNVILNKGTWNWSRMMKEKMTISHSSINKFRWPWHYNNKITKQSVKYCDIISICPSLTSRHDVNSGEKIPFIWAPGTKCSSLRAKRYVTLYRVCVYEPWNDWSKF